MRIIVDRDRCVSTGSASPSSPRILRGSRRGYVHIHGDAIADADEAALLERRQRLPSAALSIRRSLSTYRRAIARRAQNSIRIRAGEPSGDTLWSPRIRPRA